jgi:selenocysteine lyase/cysteine desulfurase
MFPAENPASIVRALKADRIVVDYRPGHVRVSPYFYNTVDEHALLIERLRTLIQAQ